MNHQERKAIYADIKQLSELDTRIEQWYNPSGKILIELDTIMINKSKYILKLKGEIMGSEDAFNSSPTIDRKKAQISLLEGELAIFQALKLVTKKSIGTAAQSTISEKEIHMEKEVWKSKAEKYHRAYEFNKQMYEDTEKDLLFYSQMLIDQTSKLLTQQNH